MARPLSPQSVNTLAGAAGILVVIGIAFYLKSMSAVPAVPPATQALNLGVITTDLKAPDAKNVFEMTEPLLQGGNAQMATTNAAPVTYSSDEIGKTDITQLGQ